jgi:tetratricopeptide (TPR) repeat protein
MVRNHHRTLKTALRVATLVGALLFLAPCTAQSVQLLLVRADSLLDSDKPQRALDVYDQAIKKESSTATFLGRARAWYALDRMDRFLQDVESALRIDSSSAEAHYQRAVYALRTEDSATAEYHAGKAIANARENRLRARSCYLRGEALFGLNRNEVAIASFEQGLALGMEDANGMRLLARLYDNEDRYSDALRILERLCEMDPGDLGHWTNRGYELIMLARYDEALPMIERALGYDPDEPVALSNRAYLHLKTGKDKEAWADVEKSLRNYPSNPYALRTRAMLRLKRGERDKACDDLTVAKALGDVPEVDQLLKDNCGSAPKKR